MRLMALAHGAEITVRAAHGRVIAVGEVVDFDEVIGTMGASYSLGVALGPDVDKFESAPAPAPVQEPEPEPVPVEPGPADMEPEPVDPPVVALVQEPAPEPVPVEPAPAES